MDFAGLFVLFFRILNPRRGSRFSCACAATCWWKAVAVWELRAFMFPLSSAVNNVGVSYSYPEYYLHVPDLDNVSVPHLCVLSGTWKVLTSSLLVSSSSPT